MNSVESAYQQRALQIQNIIEQLQFSPYVEILFFLSRIKTFFLSLISVYSGLRRQIYQKVKVETLDQCADWSQIFDQKDKGTVSLSPFWCHYPTTFPCSNSPMETLGKEFILQVMLERILIYLLFLLLF